MNYLPARSSRNNRESRLLHMSLEGPPEAQAPRNPEQQQATEKLRLEQLTRWAREISIFTKVEPLPTTPDGYGQCRISLVIFPNGSQLEMHLVDVLSRQNGPLTRSDLQAQILQAFLTHPDIPTLYRLHDFQEEAIRKQIEGAQQIDKMLEETGYRGYELGDSRGGFTNEQSHPRGVYAPDGSFVCRISLPNRTPLTSELLGSLLPPNPNVIGTVPPVNLAISSVYTRFILNNNEIPTAVKQEILRNMMSSANNVAYFNSITDVTVNPLNRSLFFNIAHFIIGGRPVEAATFRNSRPDAN